ncbi:AbrB/MazE/SpoVT family DNA-binding domain-containing protein [Paenibacillus glucanolyticus]|uniref:AbrB/MazE/SpoVT family DNA-binding domain-containing protein n=1 Tax=Paenibacillus glucanolyticus TaxID=59843 RepID=UPI0035DC82F6
MKSTGIVRSLDNLGRIVIPIELRHTLGIDPSDPMEIFVDGENVVLKKYQPGCYLCGSSEGKMTFFYGKTICNKCVSEIGRSAARQKL